MKKETTDQIVGRALRGEPYTPAGEDAAVELRSLHSQVAALTQPTSDVMPLLIRDIANDLGKTAIEVMQVLKDTGHGNTSVNTAVTRAMAATLRQRFEAAPTQVSAVESNTAYAALIHDLEVIANTTLHATIEGSRKSYERDVVRKAIEVIRASHGQAPAGAADWWRKRADEIEAQVAHTGSQEAMRCYTDMRTLLQAATAQAAPAPTHQQALEDALRERDEADDFIDTLLDEVLGANRAEWSSAYGRAEALEDVRERITALHKPTVDRAWDQFQAATAPAAGAVAGPAATVIKRGADREFMSERLGHLPDGIYSLYLAAPTPAAQADSGVQEDAARVQRLIDAVGAMLDANTTHEYQAAADEAKGAIDSLDAARATGAKP